MPRTSTSPLDSALVGKAIRHTRTAAGVTQGALAERLGVSAAYVGKLETGRANPTVGMLSRVARALDARLAVEFRAEQTPAAAGAVSLLRG
jgi:transcriptional regulator with XRE-family HTH domain